jgi:hypothetical protein
MRQSVYFSRNISPRTRLAARKAGLISPAEYAAPANKASLPNQIQEETDIM